MDMNESGSLRNYVVRLDKPIAAEKDETGRGCYGAVFKSRLNGGRCVAKKLHDILLGVGVYQPVSRSEWSDLVAKFQREIDLLSKQRHPNIVQFLGVCGLDGDPRDIQLVMEELDTDLTRFITNYKGSIPVALKLSILRDTACGVNHLHSSGVVHRDLNANNVLLSKSLQAKVADLGVSRFIPANLQYLTKGLSLAPGAIHYMSPEVLQENPSYGVKLDCFSFGHLSLYLAVEVYPFPSELSVDKLDLRANKDGQLLTSLQIQKRKKWIDMLEENHALKQLICVCLHDFPEKRYDMKEARDVLEDMLSKRGGSKCIPQLMDLMIENEDKKRELVQLKEEWRKDKSDKETKLIELKQECEVLIDERESLLNDLNGSHEQNAILTANEEELLTNNEALMKENLAMIDLLKTYIPRKDDSIAAIEKAKEERDKHLCKFKLFGDKIKKPGEILERKIEIHEDALFAEAIKKAHKLLGYTGRVPLERCRLVKYDDFSETLDQSLDIDEFGDQTFGQVVGGARNYYSFELYLETRNEHETFQKYNKGGMKIKLLLVDLNTGEVTPNLPMRAEHGWTVGEFKGNIGKLLDLDAAHMVLVLEMYSDSRLMSNDTATLVSEGLIYREHAVFVSSDPFDCQKPYNDSLMCKHVKGYLNSIMLNIILPPQQCKSSVPKKHTKRDIQLRVDRRTTLAELKKKLEVYVGVKSMFFRMYRYKNQQEYEIEKPSDTLMSTPSESKIVVRLGRALLPGEHRVKLFLLRVNESEFFKLMMEAIVAKNTPIGEFKNQIEVEAKQQGVECELKANRMRLRKKSCLTPGTVYPDNLLIDKDVYIYAGSEMFVEPLECEEPMKSGTQMQLYIRRWRPSQYVLDPYQEVVLDTANPEELKRKISACSSIPVDKVSIAKGVGSFPADMSVLDVESDLDWDPAIKSINSSPFSFYDDGGVVYYKDSAEVLMELSTEKKNDLRKSEVSRLNKNSVQGTGSTSYSNYSYYRKEKALKIYTEEDKKESED